MITTKINDYTLAKTVEVTTQYTRQQVEADIRQLNNNIAEIQKEVDKWTAILSEMDEKGITLKPVEVKEEIQVEENIIK